MERRGKLVSARRKFAAESEAELVESNLTAATERAPAADGAFD